MDRTTHTILMVAAAWLAACGGTAQGGGAGGSGAETNAHGGSGGVSQGGSHAGGGYVEIDSRQTYCEVKAATYGACNPDSDWVPDVERCVAGEACFETLIREEARLAFMECLANGTCEQSDDDCMDQVGTEVGPAPSQPAYEAACLDALTSCTGWFSNDYCTVGDIPWQLFPDSLYQVATACFEAPCEEIAICLEDVMPWNTAVCDDAVEW